MSIWPYSLFYASVTLESIDTKFVVGLYSVVDHQRLSLVYISTRGQREHRIRVEERLNSFCFWTVQLEREVLLLS